MSSSNRTKSGATPRRDAVRRASVARRRADLSGTAPWAFRVPATTGQGPQQQGTRQP